MPGGLEKGQIFRGNHIRFEGHGGCIEAVSLCHLTDSLDVKAGDNLEYSLLYYIVECQKIFDILICKMFCEYEFPDEKI